MNITLYGFMGVGKTTVGELLAEKLGYEFIDMDVRIEKTSGMAVNEIFRVYGEPSFRQLERVLVEELSERDGLVIACGGGVVADPVNAEVLQSSSRMVYLSASIDEIIKRTSDDNTRPLLDVPNPYEVASKLLTRREPVYRKYAEVIVDTTGLSPNEVVSTIMEELK